MGIANVIPGVSGGTIALITNIYEDFIQSLKSFNIHALNLFLKGKIKEFILYTDLYFLLTVFGGSIISVFSIAKLFKFLLNNYPILIWAFFFGCRTDMGCITIAILGTSFNSYWRRTITSCSFI